MSDTVRDWARNQLGSRVGSGECFDLADRALRAGNFKSAADFGTITADADYVWGTQETNSANWRAGYIIQFRNYVQRVDRDNPDGSGSWTTEERPHHTAIIDSINADGSVVVLEQNAPVSSAVHRTTLFLASKTFTEGQTTVTVSVTGTTWVYRPVPR
jgi:hypothetical protein